MKKMKVLMLCIAFLTLGCSSSKLTTTENKHTEKHRMLTSLTFQKNDAEEAMNYYVSLFEDAKIIDIERWGAKGPTKEGTIMQAVIEINGHRFMASDSPHIHNWDFTPAVSIYMECESQAEIERIFSKLSENGDVAMPLNSYGFSQK